MNKPSLSVIISMVFPIIVMVIFWTQLNKPISENLFDLPTEIQEIDQRLAETQPDIILVGSSLTNRAVNTDYLAKTLGIAPTKIQTVWSGMATMPAMTLMIENRILKQKIKPMVVAILAPPNWLTQTEILQDANFSLHQTAPLSPILSEVLGREVEVSPSPWKQRKNDFQNTYKQWNQNIFGSTILGRTTKEVDMQLDTLFAVENQRKNIKGTQLIQHNVRKTEEEREITHIENTFDLRLLEHIASELSEHDIQFLVVTLPVSEPVKKNYVLNSSEMAQMIDILSKHKASFVDFFDWSERNVFGDTKHMSARGRKLFTPLFSERLKEIKILTSEPVVATIPEQFLKPTLVWPNTNIEDLLNPQESLTLRFPESKSERSLTACLSSTTPNSQYIFAESKSRTGTDILWCEELTLRDVVKNQNIELHNQSNQRIQLHSLKLNDTELLNTPNAIFAEMKDWELNTSIPTTQYPILEATQWSKWLIKKREQFPSLQVGEVTRFKSLSDVGLTEHGVPLECPALNIQQNGNDIPLSTCKTIWKNQSGTCFYRKNLLSLQNSPIVWSTLNLQLSKDRLCHPKNKKVPIGYWVFPGDVSTTVFNWPKGDYSQLQLKASKIGSGEWQIKLVENDAVFLQTMIEEPLEFKHTIQLHKAMLKRHNKVQVEVSIPKNSNTFLFIRHIEVGN